ncbi:MAG TPA: class I SAM-dependent methyltransferase [Planktothrix sp.]|jgi:SAM-dependent methyltransferase
MNQGTAVGTYETLFNSRGGTYDQAMRDFPHARKHEFETLLKVADLQIGDKVCDTPSGGGYVADYITHNVHLTLLETSKVFFELSQKTRACDSVLAKENVIPFADGHFDKILSLAGLHHNMDKEAFFAECARTLRPGGALCIGDVHSASGIAAFLNRFVHNYSEEGHDGHFLDEQTLIQIENAGLHVESAEVISYPWNFNTRADLIKFSSMLFGVSRASSENIWQNVESYVGIEEKTDIVSMNWQLYFIRATKR